MLSEDALGYWCEICQTVVYKISLQAYCLWWAFKGFIVIENFLVLIIIFFQNCMKTYYKNYMRIINNTREGY